MDRKATKCSNVKLLCIRVIRTVDLHYTSNATDAETTSCLYELLKERARTVLMPG